MTTLIDSVSYLRSGAVTPEKNFESSTTVATTASFTPAQSDKQIVVFVRYESFSPDGDNVAGVDQIQAILERETVSGDWQPVATQSKEVAGQITRGRHYLTFGPDPVDPGQNVLTLDTPEGQLFDSHFQGRLIPGKDYRVRIALKAGSVQLDEVCLTIAYEFAG